MGGRWPAFARADAAGGLGFGMMAFYGATLRSGVEIVSDAVHLRDRLRGVDLCITVDQEASVFHQLFTQLREGMAANGYTPEEKQ